MKLSKETINILKTFSTINNGIVLTPGNFIMTRSVNNAIYAEATIEDNLDLEVAIYDLNGFLSVLGLFDEPEVLMDDDGNLLVKNSTTTISLAAADPSTIVSPRKRLNVPEACINVELPGVMIQQLKSVARGLLNIDTLAIQNKDGKIVLNGFNLPTDPQLKKPLYSTILGDYEGTNTFKMILNLENIKVPRNEDYVLSIWASGQRQVATLTGKFDKHVIALEDGSTHDFE